MASNNSGSSSTYNNNFSHISQEELLSALLASNQFSHYKKVGENDWRDPTEKNAGFSISPVGYMDHRTGESGNLFKLAKDNGLLHQNLEGQWQITDSAAPETSPRLKVIDGKKGNSPTPQYIWNNCSRFWTGAAKSYLNRRSIESLPEGWSRYIKANIDNSGIVMPVLTVSEAKKALEGNEFKVDKINTVFTGSNAVPKKILKGRLDEPNLTILPSPSGEKSDHIVVFEGFEDACSMATLERFKNCYFALSHGKNNLHNVNHFAKGLGVKQVSIWADNDQDGGALDKAKQEQKKLEENGVECFIYHHHEVGLDANDALQKGRLEEFIKEAERLEYTDHQRESVVHSNVDRSKEKEVTPPFQNVFDICYTNVDPPNYLIDELIEKGTLIVLNGEPESGKSLMAVRIAVSVATGIEFFGKEVEEAKNVIYFCGEGNAGIMRRFNVLGTELNINEAKLLINSRTPILTDEDDVSRTIAEVEAFCRDEKPSLLIFDTLHRHFGFEDENSSVAMAKFVHACNQFQEKFDCAVLVVHHVGKDRSRGGRGSSALRGAVDTELLMEKDQDIIKFCSTKTKDSPPLKIKGFRVESRDVMKNGSLLADKRGLPVTSAILIETSLSESSESSSAAFSNRQRGRQPKKTGIAVGVFKRLRDAYGDRDVKLSELKSALFKDFPNEFNSGAWRDNTGSDPDKGKTFKKLFEFNQSEDWIRLRNDSDSEGEDEEGF